MKSKILTMIIVIAMIYIASYLLGQALDFDAFSDKIAVIPITGMILPSDPGFFVQQAGTSSSTIIEFLKSAEKDKKVKGIILEINSPGGTVVASKEIADEVKKSQKPVTALIKDVGASGGYWIASAADVIVSDPLSITGSIGVTASYLEFSKLFEEYGITYQPLKSGEYKDIGSPFKELTSEEEKIIQKKIQKIHEAFVSEVSSNRNLPKEKVQELATGVYYLGEEAYELGLVDYLGGKDLAINLTKQAANLTDAKLITYKKERTIFDLFSSVSASSFYYMGLGFGDSKKIELSPVMPTV